MKNKISYIVILILSVLSINEFNKSKSIEYKVHNEYYINLTNYNNLDNANMTSDAVLNMDISLFGTEIYLEQKFIYFLNENILRILQLVQIDNKEHIILIFSSLNIFLFLIILIYKMRLSPIYVICITAPQIIVLAMDRGMGIYFLSQNLLGRFNEFLKSLFFPLTSNSPLGYEPRSSVAILISLIIIGSSIEFKNRNTTLGLVLAFIPLVHLPTSLIAIPIVLTLWRLKIINLFTVCFYFLIIGLLSIRLLFSIKLIQNSNLILPINLIIVGIIILACYRLIISKNREYEKFTKNSIYNCHKITLFYLILSLSLTTYNFYLEKNGYYIERYWIGSSINELPARINSILTIPLYFIAATFILRFKRRGDLERATQFQ